MPKQTQGQLQAAQHLPTGHPLTSQVQPFRNVQITFPPSPNSKTQLLLVPVCVLFCFVVAWLCFQLLDQQFQNLPHSPSHLIHALRLLPDPSSPLQGCSSAGYSTQPPASHWFSRVLSFPLSWCFQPHLLQICLQSRNCPTQKTFKILHLSLCVPANL